MRCAAKWCAVGALTLALCLGSGAAAQDSATPTSATSRASSRAGEFEIRAQRLTLDPDANTARFAGEVVVRRGALVLRCERLDLTYDASAQRPTRLVAAGAVKLSQEGLFATAERAVWTPTPKPTAPPKASQSPKGSVALTGAPSVWRGPHRLRAKRIVVNLDTGVIDAEQPQGAFALPSPKKPQHTP